MGRPYHHHNTRIPPQSRLPLLARVPLLLPLPLPLPFALPPIHHRHRLSSRRRTLILVVRVALPQARDDISLLAPRLHPLFE